MRKLRLLHLYPRELGINGDVGNITALLRRAQWRSIDVEVHQHDPGDHLSAEFDLIHIGSGPLSGQRAAYPDLQRITPLLLDARDAGTPILAIAGGWQLLGRTVVTPDGEQLTGAGIFPTSAVLSARRTVGEIVVRTKDGVIAGFENHSSTVALHTAAALGRVLAGGGNTPGAPESERMEGVRIGNAIGTNLHGPVLPMNPTLADQLLTAALQRRGGASPDLHDPATLEQLRTVDGYATQARAALAARIGVAL